MKRILCVVLYAIALLCGARNGVKQFKPDVFMSIFNK
jgi:hypothetical protein